MDCKKEDKQPKRKYSTCGVCDKKYLIGGSNSYRTVRNCCKKCHKERAAENNRNNKERHYKAIRKYYKKNKEKWIEYSNEYQKKHCAELHDNYILSLLRRRGNKDGKYYKNNIDNIGDIVEKQRVKLMLEREIKEEV